MAGKRLSRSWLLGKISGDKTSQSYRYTPLETEFHIRVLSFKHPQRPAKPEDWSIEYNGEDIHGLENVEFELLQVDLREKPVYQALSYVWGDPKKSSKIVMKDGTNLRINKNLREALVRLVSGFQQIPVWIDQLCINQEDLAERSHQVSIMGTIYMGAECTVAWLGEEPKDCKGYAGQVILSVRHEQGAEKMEEKRQAWLKSHVALSCSRKNPSVKELRFKAIQAILNRPWFKRAWVFQEAVLSKTIILAFGKEKFSLEEFTDIAQDLMMSQYKIDGYINSLAKSGAGWDSLDSINHLRGHAYRHSKDFVRFLWNAGGQWEATEKRDMIFAFLGLLNKPGLFDPLDFDIKPDYTAPLDELYTSLTRKIIESTGDLDVLGQVIGFEPALSPKNMCIGSPIPTWVPDWAISTPIVVPFTARDTHSFNASKGYQHRVLECEDPETLLVSGRIVTKVLHAINWDSEAHNFMDVNRKWINLDWHVAELCKIPAAYTLRPPTRERVLKTLLADNARPGFHVDDEFPSKLPDKDWKSFLQAYDMWPRIAAGESVRYKEEIEHNLHQLQQMSLILQHKSLAVCENGYLALIPRICGFSCAGIRADLGLEFEIAILHGSRSPVVLADAGGAETDEHASYNVCGQCYLEDHMYGEVVYWEEDDGDVMALV